jgi:hypothetical protein
MLIEIDLSKLERGLRREKVKVRRKTGTTYEYRRIGRKEEEKPKPEPKVEEKLDDDLIMNRIRLDKISDLGVKVGSKINWQGDIYTIERIRADGIIDIGGGKMIWSTAIGEVVGKKKPKKEIIKKPKVEEKPKKEISEYKGVPGMKGSSPTYKSLPENFTLNTGVVTQMKEYKKESRKLGREVGSGIDIVRGEMVLGKMGKGSDEAILITGKTKYGSYHTHPSPASDTFSLEDILGLISIRPVNLTMAHTVKNNNLWVAVSSAETREMISKMEVKELMAMKKRYRGLSSMASSGSEKEYRNFVKRFCNQYKIGLYVGKSNEELKKYDGSW